MCTGDDGGGDGGGSVDLEETERNEEKYTWNFNTETGEYSYDSDPAADGPSDTSVTGPGDDVLIGSGGRRTVDRLTTPGPGLVVDIPGPRAATRGAPGAPRSTLGTPEEDQTLGSGQGAQVVGGTPSAADMEQEDRDFGDTFDRSAELDQEDAELGLAMDERSSLERFADNWFNDPANKRQSQLNTVSFIGGPVLGALGGIFGSIAQATNPVTHTGVDSRGVEFNIHGTTGGVSYQNLEDDPNYGTGRVTTAEDLGVTFGTQGPTMRNGSLQTVENQGRTWFDTPVESIFGEPNMNPYQTTDRGNYAWNFNPDGSYNYGVDEGVASGDINSGRGTGEPYSIFSGGTNFPDPNDDDFNDGNAYQNARRRLATPTTINPVTLEEEEFASDPTVTRPYIDPNYSIFRRSLSGV